MTPDQLIDSAERMLLQANNRVDRVMWARRYLELIEARPADRESADRAASSGPKGVDDLRVESTTDVGGLETAPKRPLLRYHGGKWKLAPWILSQLPDHRVYVEPFGGAASVLLRKPRSYAEIYNDLDGEIVNLFRVVRDCGDELIQALHLTPFSRDEFAESYEPTADPLEQARRTVLRSFMGFGSAAASGAKTGFRSNSNRSGTTPAHDWKNFPLAIGALIDRLRGVVIENRNAFEVMLAHDGPKTLHYCDPPYVLDTRSIKNPYCKKGYRYEMTDEQHREFASFVSGLEGMVVVSGYSCPLYDELFQGWEQVSRDAHADGARDRVEVLWMNKACVRSQRQTTFFTESVKQNAPGVVSGGVL